MFVQGVTFEAVIGIVVQTVFDIVGSCFTWTRRGCCKDLVLTQGAVCEALVFVKCVAFEALVLLWQGVMHVVLLCSYKALHLRLLH